MQYSSSLPDDKPGKIGRGNKLTGTFDLEACLRGPRSAVLERELERERRLEPFGGPGKAEMGAEDGGGLLSFRDRKVYYKTTTNRGRR